MADKIPVTVVVPVRNEELAIGQCLGRLTRFGEIIVIDSASTDRTVDTALAHGARLVNFQWNGRYPKKRNWLLMNHKLSFDWVLFLDADELVDPGFCEAVNLAVRSGRYNGYWLNYTNYFLGRPLRHGVPQRKLALFRVGTGLYEKIDEDFWSGFDMEIHEHPVIEGSVGEIEARIDHKDDRGLARFVTRHREYAVWEARRVQALVRGDVVSWSGLTDRQRFKYRHIVKWWYPWFYLFYTYVVKRGFLDGASGFYYAIFKVWYFILIRLLVLEAHKSSVQ
jgi:glycosyltransferase involved in cell wall biosynthesis